MKKINYLKNTILLGLAAMLAVSCGDGNKDKVLLSKDSGNPVKPDQFPFYKNLQVRPGLNFEVVSWGKGVDSIGGYLVLMSDSVRNNFKSLSNEREGIITDAWNMDLDNDGNPEVYVQFEVRKNVNDLSVYEYSGGSFNKITFPGLSSSLKKNYEGGDKFFVKEGDLYRTFPIVNPKDASEKAGDLKKIKYQLSGNRFSFSEVKE